MFIEVVDLKKGYITGEVRNEVLRGISMAMDRGEVGVILGPSGSGKSTLLNIIGGVDRAESGRVIVDGVEINNLSDDELTEYRRGMLALYSSSITWFPILRWGKTLRSFPISAKHH